MSCLFVVFNATKLFDVMFVCYLTQLVHSSFENNCCARNNLNCLIVFKTI
jgi:hypothetical protein